MSFTPANLAPSFVGLAAWGYWTYHVIRGVLAIGGLGLYWAARGLFGKITFVIWAFFTASVVVAFAIAIIMAVCVGVWTGVKAIVGAVRSRGGPKS